MYDLRKQTKRNAVQIIPRYFSKVYIPNITELALMQSIVSLAQWGRLVVFCADVYFCTFQPFPFRYDVFAFHRESRNNEMHFTDTQSVRTVKLVRITFQTASVIEMKWAIFSMETFWMPTFAYHICVATFFILMVLMSSKYNMIISNTVKSASRDVSKYFQKFNSFKKISLLRNVLFQLIYKKLSLSCWLAFY